MVEFWDDDNSFIWYLHILSRELSESGENERDTQIILIFLEPTNIKQERNENIFHALTQWFSALEIIV